MRKFYTSTDQIGSGTERLNTSGTVIDKEDQALRISSGNLFSAGASLRAGKPFGDSSLRTFTKKRYRYVGKEKDQESGLYYYGARYYAPWTARFISVDPLAGKFADLTPYNYAGNKPINKVDIDGLQEEGRSGTPSGRESGGGKEGGGKTAGAGSGGASNATTEKTQLHLSGESVLKIESETTKNNTLTSTPTFENESNNIGVEEALKFEAKSQVVDTIYNKIESSIPDLMGEGASKSKESVIRETISEAVDIKITTKQIKIHGPDQAHAEEPNTTKTVIDKIYIFPKGDADDLTERDFETAEDIGKGIFKLAIKAVSLKTGIPDSMEPESISGTILGTTLAVLGKASMAVGMTIDMTLNPFEAGKSSSINIMNENVRLTQTLTQSNINQQIFGK
ncbi:MAG: RHS repeat-associated core domain-containing protein [Flavobacteriales bacterium]|nr:RHS repeat-associated core domain-containing protein [Flavobacteriales bacterium]